MQAAYRSSSAFCRTYDSVVLEAQYVVDLVFDEILAHRPKQIRGVLSR